MAIIPSSRGTMFYDPQHRLYQTSNQGNMNHTDQVYTMQDIIDTVAASTGAIANNSTVVVHANGTDAENGQELQAAIVKATEMTGKQNSVSDEAYSNVDPWVSYSVPGTWEFTFSWQNTQTGLVLGVPYDYTADLGEGEKTYQVTIVSSTNDRNATIYLEYQGQPQGFASGQFLSWPGTVPLLKTTIDKAVTVIMSTGKYELSSPLEIDSTINLVSLTGQRETVYIYGDSIDVKSAASLEALPIVIGGFDCDNLSIESNLYYITYREIRAKGEGNFQPKNYGAGSSQGTFYRCFSGNNSFGSGNSETVPTGVSSDGTYIECSGTSNMFGCKMADSSGLYMRCGYGTNNSVGNEEDPTVTQAWNSFGFRGDENNGYFQYCNGGYESFGSEAQNIGAIYISCHSDYYRTFASKAYVNNGTFIGCTADGRENFSFSPQGDHSGANYINCTAYGNSYNFGGPDQYGMHTPFEGNFINCWAINSTFNFGNGPSYYSVKTLSGNMLGGGTVGANADQGLPAVSGNGKIRNGIDWDYSIVTVG